MNFNQLYIGLYDQGVDLLVNARINVWYLSKIRLFRRIFINGVVYSVENAFGLRSQIFNVYYKNISYYNFFWIYLWAVIFLLILGFIFIIF